MCGKAKGPGNATTAIFARGCAQADDKFDKKSTPLVWTFRFNNGVTVSYNLTTHLCSGNKCNPATTIKAGGATFFSVIGLIFALGVYGDSYFH